MKPKKIINIFIVLVMYVNIFGFFMINHMAKYTGLPPVILFTILSIIEVVSIGTLILYNEVDGK